MLKQLKKKKKKCYDQSDPGTHLRHRGHKPHRLLWVGEEDFGHNSLEDGEDLVAGVTHSGDKLGEGCQELVWGQVVTVLHHHGVDFPHFLTHLPVHTSSCGGERHTHTHALRRNWNPLRELHVTILSTHLSHTHTLVLQNPARGTACEAWPGRCTGFQTVGL